VRIGLSQVFRRINYEVPFFRPVGLACLASHVRARFPDVEVIFRDNPLDLLDQDPDLIGLYVTSCFFSEARRLTRLMKRSARAPIILGGPHISTLWESLPEWVDVGVIGEGELTFEELVGLAREEGGLPTERLLDIKGIVLRKDGDLVRTPPRAPVHDLDTLPPPDRHIFPPGSPPYIISSRGCPFSCVFCSPRNIWQGIRLNSVERVLEETAQVIPLLQENRKLRYRDKLFLAFQDDLFASRKDRLAAIGRGLDESGMSRRIALGVSVQAVTFDEEICGLLKRLGVLSVTFGAESGSDPVLKFLKGPRSSVERNQRVIDLCHEAGIQVICSFIIGSPGETLEDMGRTYEFIHRNREKLLKVEVVPLMPFPGTKIWEHASRRGLVSLDMDWERIDLLTTAAHPEKMPYLNTEVPGAKFLEVVREFHLLRHEITSGKDRELMVYV
jgi:radical SAM superfamily enzyme YgiQ (UPF0313 family)